MNDRRLYARLTLDFADSPKIAPLSDRAFREYIEALLWARRLMTDGVIPERMVRRLFTPEALEELTNNGGSGASSIIMRDDGSAEIHDFSEHQSTRAQIEKWSAAGKKAASARYSSTASTSDDTETHAIRMRPPSGSHAQTETETETKTGKKTATPRQRGSRIDENFVVDDALRAYAREKAPAVDVNREREKFVNYWLAASGKNAIKIDWRRAFMTWLGNAQQYAEERGWQPQPAAEQGESSQSQMLRWLEARGVTRAEWDEKKGDRAWVASLSEITHG